MTTRLSQIATSPDSHLKQNQPETTESTIHIPPAASRVGLLSKAVLQESQSCIALRLRHTHKPGDEAGVDKDGFETGDGVNADDGMGGLDWLAAGNGGGSVTRCGLVETGMQGGEGFKIELVGAGKGGVDSVAGRRQ